MVEWKQQCNNGDNGQLVERGGDDSSNCDTVSLSSTVEVDEELTTDGLVSSGNLAENSSFGNIAVNNSSDIHFGNKTFYQGPVTIKQIVYATNKDQEEVFRDGFPGVTSVTGVKCIDGVTDLEKTNNSVGVDSLLNKGSRWGSLKGHVITGISLVVGVALIVTTSLLVTLSATSNTSPSQSVPNYSIYSTEGDTATRPEYNVTLSGKLRVLSRKTWLAQPPVRPHDPLHHPVPYVIVSHTASENCSSQADCIFYVRTMQTYHIESYGWDDIGYNFLIGGDGYVYEGRGWDGVGAHAYGYNKCSIGISFIGTYITMHPTPKTWLALQQLITDGIKLGKISPRYRLLGHRQVSATESPGQALFDDIKGLSHWSELPMTCDQVANTNITLS